MKKALLVGLTVLICLLTACAPVKGNYAGIDESTTNKILLNSGSMFVYTFCDEETGVWYVSSSRGVTPRLKADGSLYVSEKRSRKE